MQSLRTRREARVTIGEVLVESRNLPIESTPFSPTIAPTPEAVTFDADEPPNYFARSLEWALHPHKLVLRPLARLTGGGKSTAADDACTATGLFMHDVDDQSIATARGLTPHETIHREISATSLE